MIPSGVGVLTGGSGFLGRAILRRSHRENWPVKWIVYSRDEMKQWELKQRFPEVQCVLGDVARNLERMVAVFSGANFVWHLGAVKFIPEAEKNVAETIEVNVTGSMNVGVAAIAAGIETVVGISTDKACAPLNTYGMTKALMERMYSELNTRGKTNFVTVRYGNVIGSTGSVIPVFKDQIKRYGEIRITDPKMTRFWFSVDEAINLILWAHENSFNYSGHTFISTCPAMSIWDIAGTVWDMNPEGSRKISIMGIRPGEKLHEQLLNAQEAPRAVKTELGYVMAPATVSSVENGSEEGYSSYQPNRWLTSKEMRVAILDAESV